MLVRWELASTDVFVLLSTLHRRADAFSHFVRLEVPLLRVRTAGRKFSAPETACRSSISGERFARLK